eukprot:Phypoly_transcript_03005.p1 GENE.Phypoly_transcript_03005~~Phypoly_transcript_03005.p1  ORF type:complete len:632 (+),score=69.82 Phypoly_transcript_03005:211-2106(+)
MAIDVDMNVEEVHQCATESYSFSDDFWMAIFTHLDAASLCVISQTCYGLYILAEDKLLWLNLLQRDRKKVIRVPKDTLMHPKDFYRRRKDFDSITEAIHSANPESRERIYVAPGTYKESLEITVPIDIIGEGPIGSVIIEGNTANTILSTATEGLVSNVCLRQTGHWFCVDVEKGSIHIEGCDITNSTLSAVKVGKDGSPVIANNKIHDTHEAGVAVFGGSGIIENNQFYKNRYGSIEIVYQTANPIIRNNLIRSNRGYGIHVHTLSRPIIQGNTIHDNESDGISCWGGADPYVTGNKIMRNRGDGIYIHEDGKGVFENNEIFNQKLDGIRTSKSCPSLLNNSIHNNDGDGVRIVINANPTVKGNKIYENNRVGVHVYRDGCGTCTENHIYGNKNAGMQVYGGGNTQVLRNRIQYNRCTGIYVSDRASVSLQQNEISYNGDCGVEIVSGAHVPSLEGNKIHHNKSAGMAVYNDTTTASAEVHNFFHSNGVDYYVPYNPDAMDTSGYDAIPSCGASTNILMREGKALYPKIMKTDGHHPEIVSFLAERAIHAKLCTFTFTREYYHAQYWYECRTCSSPRQILGRSEVSVCEQCAKACHVGHDLSPRKFGHFYCDCGQMTSTICKCTTPPTTS